MSYCQEVRHFNSPVGPYVQVRAFVVTHSDNFAFGLNRRLPRQNQWLAGAWACVVVSCISRSHRHRHQGTRTLSSLPGSRVLLWIGWLQRLRAVSLPGVVLECWPATEAECTLSFAVSVYKVAMRVHHVCRHASGSKTLQPFAFLP